MTNKSGRLTIIARCDNTGLGVQSRNWVRLLKPGKIILIDSSPFNNNKQNGDWYKEGDIWPVYGFIKDQHIDKLLDDTDVLLTFEVPYNYNLLRRARQRGIKTILQNNWEFTDYLKDSSLPLPDLLVNHSYWHLDDQKNIWPEITGYCPTPLFVEDFNEILEENLSRKDKIRFLHIAGRNTYEDRNGTNDVLQAISLIPENVDFELVIKTQTTEVKEIDDPRVTVDRNAPDDEKELYRNFDAMIMPRRYAGACLARGTRIMLPISGDSRNIEDICVGDLISDIHGDTTVTGVSRRTVDSYIKVRTPLGTLESSSDHIHMVTPSENHSLAERTAKDVSKDEWLFVRRPDASGITSVHIGKKPTVRALSNWIEDIEITPDLARVIGLWLAEGYGNISKQKSRVRGVHTLYWAFGHDEENFAKYVVEVLRRIGAHATYRKKVSHVTYSDKSWVYEVRCRSTLVYQLFEKLNLGHGAKNKVAPNLDSSLALHMIGGWIDGDGCGQNMSIEGHSESTELIRSISTLLLKCGVMHTINKGGRRIQIFGTERHKLEPYLKRVVSHGISSGRKPQNWRDYNNGWIVRIKSVEVISGELDVVSIETDSGTYIANNFATHNCLPMNEALASGLPVIMTDIDPNNKILPKHWLVKAEKKTSFLARTVIDVYSADHTDLAGRIAQFAVMSPKTLKGNKLAARDIAIKEYSSESVLEKWALLLDKIGV